MSQPPVYTPQHSFVADSATLANFPGQALDVEFRSVKATTDAIETNLALIQRDDGAIANNAVGFDQLSVNLQTSGLVSVAAWASGVSYAAGAGVVQAGGYYRASVAHVSGNFAADLAAGKWAFVATLISAVTSRAVSQANYTLLGSDSNTLLRRSNSGVAMVDTLPGVSVGVLPVQTLIYVKNTDITALLTIRVTNAGSKLDGSTTGYVILGPQQSVAFFCDGTDYYSIGAPGRIRLPLAVATTIYVGGVGAADTNPGTTSTLPFATLQRAADEVCARYDLSESQLIVQAAAGTYAPFLMRGRPPGVGNSSGTNPFYHSLLFKGDSVTPTNCVISGSSAAPCVQAIQTTFHIDGFKYTNTVGGGIDVETGSVLGVGTANFGACAAEHYKVGNNAYSHYDNDYAISGGAPSHFLVFNGGTIVNSGSTTATLTNTPAFSGGFASAQSNGVLVVGSQTFSGAATGPRWAVGPFGGAIGAAGRALDTVFPGDTNGSDANISGLTASAAAADTDTLAVNQGGGNLKQTFAAIKTWIKSWIVKADVGLGNVANVDTTNAANLSSGTLLAARMPALTGDGTTVAGAVALTVTKINGVDQTAAWTSYTPTVTSQTGTITTATATGRYKQIGKTIILQVDVTVTTAGTGAGGLRATLPFTAAAFNYLGIGKEITVGKSGAAQIGVSGTFLDTRDSTGTTFIATGTEVVACITYEIP